jgi:hypothetical protein
VREAVGVDEVKSTVAEVREAVDIKGTLTGKAEAAPPATAPDATSKPE